MKKSLELSQDGVNYDIQVADGSEKVLDDQLIRSIAALDDVTEYSFVHDISLSARIEEAYIADELKEWGLYKERLKEGKLITFFI